MLYHTVTYTVYSFEARANYEKQASLYRKYRLTEAGAQRILRRTLSTPTLNVTRIETLLVQK